MQRAGNVMRSVLLPPAEHIGHVAVGAGHARLAVDAVLPFFEIGMLVLEDRCAGNRVDPVLFKAVGLCTVILLHRLRGQTFVPGKDEAVGAGLEIVFGMALAA